ncbi:MAG TPA: RNA methyltransferase [Clostridiaceae bacterium]|nr:RNA methyltransferase [Clostridiaceae bacterium]
MKKITSSQNPLVREAKALKNRKYRDEKGLFLIEGEKLLKEAVQEKAEIIKVFLSEEYIKEKSYDLFSSELLKHDTIILSDRLFKEISDTETPQGIIAVVKQSKHTLSDIMANNRNIIILEEIQDPGNMGTIIRTADAAGFSGVITTKGCVDVYSPKVIRSTMGSIFRIPVCTGAGISEIISRLKAEGIKVYASHLEGKASLYDIDLRSDMAIIIGNESRGLSKEASASADALVQIPMLGGAESLNASVAAAILMYECVRQRLTKDT